MGRRFANRPFVRCNMIDKKILINVSERSLAGDLSKMLRAFGCERNEIALSFDEAIEKANEFKPDLSILDISHAQILKLIDSPGADDKKIKIPSICIIDANSPEILEDEIIPEIYGFITKPVNSACLRVSVIAALKRVEYEKKLKIKEEMECFTYTVSHDLKSPLLTIQTFTGYLEQDIKNKDDGRIKVDLGYIHNAIAKMNRLLGELLEISRMGRKTNPPSESPLHEIVKEAADIVAGRIAARGIDICITDEPYILYGDRLRLVEVFQNLIDNAAKFMGDQPSPRIEIGACRHQNKIEFFVRDNGIGIDPGHQHKLFGLFEKLDPKSEGSGMGLLITKKIIGNHGGKIRLESEGAGRGTTFWFTLARSKYHKKRT